MSLGLVGRKVGMTRVFTDDGDTIPVTVVDVSNNRVTQIKTKFWIGEDEQNDLFTAAKLLMKRVDDKKLLTEESLKLSCAAEKTEKK